MSAVIAIDPGMVEQHIMELARFGACGETGVCRRSIRTSGSRPRIASCLGAARLVSTVSQDAVGSVWARLEGSEPGPSIATGSHIDSQVPGGRYDGVLGPSPPSSRCARSRNASARRGGRWRLCRSARKRGVASRRRIGGARGQSLAPSARMSQTRSSPPMARPLPRRCERSASIRRASRKRRGPISTPSSSSTSSRGRFWSTRGSRSASSRASPGFATTWWSSLAAPTMPAGCRWICGVMRWPPRPRLSRERVRRRARGAAPRSRRPAVSTLSPISRRPFPGR